MNGRTDQVISELEKVADDARNSFGSLSTQQLNWKPAADSWSVAQCLDHLIKTSEQFNPEFKKLASGTRKNTFWQNYSPFTGIGGRFLIKAVSNDSKRRKAPSKDIVPPSEIEEGIVERFASHVKDLCGRIEACGSADVKKTVVSSPFLSVMTYTLDDAYTVLVEHSKRHIRQAKGVMETEGFPKTAVHHTAV